MNKQTKYFLAIVFTPVLLLGPAIAYYGKDPNKVCKAESISTRGHGNDIESIARLKAIAEWHARANKTGTNFGAWHNASGRHVYCQKRKASGIYHCRAYGTPCKSTLPPKTAQQQSSPENP